MKNHQVRIESAPGQGTSVYVSFINEMIETDSNINEAGS
jgi:hypothetical protein